MEQELKHKITREYIELSKLHPNTGQLDGLPKNPRYIDHPSFKKLIQSIKDDPEMLEIREIVVYDTEDERGYVIIGGNMRYEALLQLKYDESPCKVIHPGFPMEKIRRIVLKDNSSFGDFDFDALLAEWEIEEINAANIKVPDIPTPEQEEEAQDDAYDVTGNTPKKATSKMGDLYQLGRHRLICGDSTKPEYLEALMDGEPADLLVTDPPYNVDYASKNEHLNRADNGKRIQTDIVSDKMSDRQFSDFLISAFRNADRIMKPGAAFYVWFADNKFTIVWNSAKACRWNVSQQLIWNKSSLVLGHLDYQKKHEPCLYGWKEGAAHYFVDKRNLTTIIERLKDLDSMTKKEMLEILKQLFGGDVPTTVIDCPKPAKNPDHPTMKPVPLIGKLISNSSRMGELVLDIFGGSGTTLIACEQLNRSCRMVEFEPVYVDVIIKRWEELSGEKARLIRNIHEGKEGEDAKG